MSDLEWYQSLGALLRMCRRYDDDLGEGEDMVFLSMAAAMCADDKVGDFANVSAETVTRYIGICKGLRAANVKGYVECWRRYAAE